MAAVQTVRCQKCGRENRAGAKFCAHCGIALPQMPPKEETKPPSQPPSPVPTLPKEEAKEAARKIWDWTKTVVTVGGRMAWQEVANPTAALEGKVVDKLKVDAVTPPNEPAFWGFVAAVVVLLVFALNGQWLIPLIGTAVTLVLSWMRWRRPYFSPMAWKKLMGLFGKPTQVPSLHLKVQTAKGETQVTLLGDEQGDEPEEGERVSIWGIFDDKTQTQLRAWKVQALDEAGQPKGQPFIVPRLFPLVPILFFASLGSLILALLMMLF